MAGKSLLLAAAVAFLASGCARPPAKAPRPRPAPAPSTRVEQDRGHRPVPPLVAPPPAYGNKVVAAPERADRSPG